VLLTECVKFGEFASGNDQGSFAPRRKAIDDEGLSCMIERPGLSFITSAATPYVDAEEVWTDIFLAISGARREILITDWWLCPTLYLMRPHKENEHSRLDVLLKRKAEEGVRIYILLYKEVALAVPLDSKWAKETLEALHPNIEVVRHWENASVKYWTHHEKIVCVDQHVAFIGGLDLCFGIAALLPSRCAGAWRRVLPRPLAATRGVAPTLYAVNHLAVRACVRARRPTRGTDLWARGAPAAGGKARATMWCCWQAGMTRSSTRSSTWARNTSQGRQDLRVRVCVCFG
jgi:hypothetical protein